MEGVSQHSIADMCDEKQRPLELPAISMRMSGNPILTLIDCSHQDLRIDQLIGDGVRPEGAIERLLCEIALATIEGQCGDTVRSTCRNSSSLASSMNPAIWE
jgi:hypothetical protein